MIKLKLAFTSLLLALKIYLLEYKIFNKFYHFFFILYFKPIQTIFKLIFKISKWFFVATFTLSYVNTYDFTVLYYLIFINMPNYHDLLQSIIKMIVNITDKILNYLTNLLEKPTITSAPSAEEVLEAYKIPKFPVKEPFDYLRASYLSPNITPMNPGYSKTELCLFIVGGVLVIGGIGYLG